MPIIRCTKKLQKEMGLRKVPNDADELESSPLASWHANLIYIARRKCVLFVNDLTLFNFIVSDVPRAQIKELGVLFRSWLSCVLSEEHLPKWLVAQIIDDCSSIRYGNTNDRSVLGSMNDLAFHYEFGILDAGGVHSAEVPYIIRKLNRMPMGALDYACAIEVLMAAYGE